MSDIDVSVDPLLPTEQDTKTTTSSSGGHVMSPASKAAIKSEYDAQQAVADAAQKVGEAQSLQKAIEADKAAEASDLAHQQAADQAAEHQAQVDRMQAARDAQAAAEDAFSNHTFHDYWSDKSVGRRLGEAFGLFAGGMGAAYLGQQNPAQVALFRDMDRDFAKQTSQLNQLRDTAKMKGQYVNDLGVQEGHDNAALATKFAKANEATAAELVQRLAESGVPLQEAETNKTVLGLRQRAEEKRRESLQHYDRTYQASTSKKEVTGEGKASAADAKKKAADEARTVYVNDQPVGLAPTARVVKGYADRAVAYDQAIKSLEEMDKGLSSWPHVAVPRGADFDNAVLAIASTTTANPSDATTKHEAGTLKNSIGLIDRDSVRKKLEDLRTRQKQFTGTLQPLPGHQHSTLPDMTPPGEGGAPAAARPQPKKERVPSADIVRMQKARSKGDHRFDEILSAEGL